jgi:hypothetical protein
LNVAFQGSNGYGSSYEIEARAQKGAGFTAAGVLASISPSSMFSEDSFWLFAARRFKKDPQFGQDKTTK